jgi:hypothetical protein
LINFSEQFLEVWKQLFDIHSTFSLYCHVYNFASIVSVIDQVWFAKLISKCICELCCLRQKASVNEVIQAVNLNIDNWQSSTILWKANQSVVSYRYEDWHTEWVSCSLFTRHWLFSVMLRTKLNDIVHLKCIGCWGRLSNMSPHSLVDCWWMSSDKEFECWKWLLLCCLCLMMI